MHRLAKLISSIGNPLLTIPLLVEFVAIKHGDPQNIPIVTAITALLFVTALLWIFYNFKKGSYSDLDVSKREQRYSLYLFIIPLVFLTAFFFHLAELPPYSIKAFLVGGGLMTLSFLSNFMIKSSLHTSLNCYLAGSVFIIDKGLGLALFILTLAVAWSRIILKRHTKGEVAMGFLIGFIAIFTLMIVADYEGLPSPIFGLIYLHPSIS